MEKGEMPGLGHSESQAGFSSLGAAENLPARSSGASQPQGSQLRLEVVCLLYRLGRGTIRAVRPAHREMYQDCELCLHG